MFYNTIDTDSDLSYDTIYLPLEHPIQQSTTPSSWIKNVFCYYFCCTTRKV